MADRIFNFSQTDGLDFQDEGIFHCQGIMLRPVNEEGIYDDVNGILRKKYIDLPTWCPHGEVFDKFWGFNTNISGPGSVMFQISPNSGATYLWFNGTDWIEVETGLDYNSTCEVEANLDKFPVVWTALRIRAFLIPASETEGPTLHLVKILFDVRPHEFMQDFYRSIKRFITETSNFVLPYETTIEESDKIKLIFEDVGVEGDLEKPLYKAIKEPIWVFDLENDPKLRENLFDSFDGIDNIVLKRTVNGKIKVLFTVIPDIHIQTDFDVVKMANHPSVTIQIVSVKRSEWDGPGNYPCHEINYSKKIARLVEGLRKYEIRTRIRSYSSKVTDSLMYSGGVRRLIEQEDRILSVFYDYFMNALWGTHHESDWVNENLFASIYTPTFIWDDWNSQGKPKEVPLVDCPDNGGGVHCNIELIKCK